MAKNYTWNSKAVIGAVGRVRAEAFRVTAMNIRKTAMRSMKKGTKAQYVSKPGEPPRRHSSALQKSILYALDERRMSAVIGPVKYKGQSKGASALEKGGTVTRTDRRKKKKVTIKIKPRPFMVPALQKEVKNMAKYLQYARKKFNK